MSTSATPVWRPALKSDQAQIDCFVCTEPAKARNDRSTNWQPEHPRLYEFHAQQMIRSLRVPTRYPVATWVMSDASGVAGVCSWSWLQEVGFAHIDVIGVSMRHRRERSSLGFMILKEALGEIEARGIEQGALEMYVECEVYNRNRCSQRLVQQVGMQKVDEAPTGAETWALRFPLAEVDAPSDGA